MPVWMGNKPVEIQQLTDKVYGKGLGIYDKDQITPTSFDLDRVMVSDFNMIFNMDGLPNPSDPVIPSASLSPSQAPSDSPSASPSPSQAPAMQAQVITDTLNVRVSPGATNSLVIPKLLKDKVITYLGEQKIANGEVWMEIDCGELGVGWICEGQNNVAYVKKI
jgi:hypothetical protein